MQMRTDSILALLGEVVAQREALADWQNDALAVMRQLIDGQPEVREGETVLAVLAKVVERLKRENAILRADAGTTNGRIADAVHLP